MIAVRLNGLDETLLSLSSVQKELPGCISRALNRSLEMVKTEQVRRAVKKYNVKSSKILSTVNIFKSSNSTLEGKIISGGRSIGLDYFKLTPKKRLERRRTVQAEVKRTGLKSIPNAFIAYRSGKLGAFVRTSESSFPIRRLVGPSAPQMLGNQSILDFLQGYTDEKFRIRLDHEIDRVMQK